MARKKAVHLKVFATRIGVRDWVVAVPSRKAALAAWDVRENLFASGAAREVKDPHWIEAALKSPGVPVAAPGQVVTIPDAGKVVSLHRDRARAKASAPAPEKKKDRSTLDAAETALAKFQKDAARKRASIERRRRDLEEEAEALERELTRDQKALEARVERERRAYERG